MEREQRSKLRRFRWMGRHPTDQRYYVHGSSDRDHRLYPHLHGCGRLSHTVAAGRGDPPAGTDHNPVGFTDDDQQHVELHADLAHNRCDRVRGERRLAGTDRDQRHLGDR